MTSAGRSATESDRLVAQFQEKAKQFDLGNDRHWRKLLFIPDRWHPSDTSIIDDPAFFLDPGGKHNPSAELAATIAAMVRQDPVTILGQQRNPHCVWPARLRFLQTRLAFPLERAACPNLDSYLFTVDFNRVSFVFSNYFVNNPGSMFGHTLLRLHRPAQPGQISDSGLLDDVVNFAAAVPDEGSLLYPLKGLLGFYPGKWTMMPYYVKIQEYNNHESRDLWEYELNLTAEEVNWLRLVIWEQGAFYIDYFFIDDNCAYMLLAALEAAKPETHLTGFMPLYGIPVDSVKAVTHEPGLVRRVTNRASTLSRYGNLERSLTTRERSTLVTMFGEGDALVPLGTHAPQSQARVIDTALELIDFKERLAGQAQAVEFAKLRPALLASRAQLGVRGELLKSEPLSTRPDLSHSSAMIGMSGGFDTTRGFGLFHWRPALHDLASRSFGYSDEMEIAFLDTELSVGRDERALTLERLQILEILSIPRAMTLISPFAWNLRLGTALRRAPHEEDAAGETLEETHYDTFVSYGFGKRLGSESASVFALIGPRVGFEKETYAAAELTLGVLVRPLTDLSVVARGEWQRRHIAPVPILTGVIHGAYAIERNWELRLQSTIQRDSLRKAGRTHELGIRRYF